MKIRPLTINGNQREEFESCDISDLSVIAGGYVITPFGEIIVVKDDDKHCEVFTKLINNYLENEIDMKYNTLTSTKMLCEIGCCVYAGVRLEYIKNKLENLSNCVAICTYEVLRQQDYNDLLRDEPIDDMHKGNDFLERD